MASPATDQRSLEFADVVVSVASPDHAALDWLVEFLGPWWRPSHGAADWSVLDYVDQPAMLDEADVFVTHHGINSTHEAIDAGVPMISYPFFGDQPDLARRCQDLGLAVPLADEPRGAVDDAAVHRALERLDEEREQVEARLVVARTWEQETIAGRPQVLDRLLALIADARVEQSE